MLRKFTLAVVIVFMSTLSFSQVLNEVLYDPGAFDGSKGEAIELHGSSGTDISCYMISDGDFVITIPDGTTIPTDGFFVIGNSEVVADYGRAELDLDLSTCGCTDGTGEGISLTNSGEFIALFNESGTIQDGLIFEETVEGNSNSPAGQILSPTNPTGCTNTDLTIPDLSAGDLESPTSPWVYFGGTSNESAARDADGSGTWTASSSVNSGFSSIGHSNATNATTWSGSSWDNGAPNASTNAIIDGDFDTGTDGDITCLNLTVNSTYDITIQSGDFVSVAAKMRDNGDNITIESGGSLVVAGDVFPSTLAGTYTVKRSTTFDASTGKYSAIGSPVDGDDTDVLGSLVYSYDETVAYSSNGNDRFVEVTSTETMAQGDAYFSAFTGDVTFVGDISYGDITVSMVYDESNDGGSTNAGFNLVSNPYASAIEYDEFMAGNSDISSTIYLWDDGGSDAGRRSNSDYITANSMGAASGGSTRSGDWDGYIRSAQGFFVKATSAADLNFTPQMQVSSNNSDAGYFRTEGYSKVRLSLTSDNYYNDILIGFADDASAELDQYDGLKLTSGNIALYSVINNLPYAIQGLPLLTDDVTVDLGMSIQEPGNYTINLNDDLFSSEYQVFLTDNLLNETINLTEAESYTFSSQVVLDDNRFSVTFSQGVINNASQEVFDRPLIYTANGKLYAEMQSGIEIDEISVYTINGQKVLHVANPNNVIEISNYEQVGINIVRIVANNEIYTVKFQMN